MKVNEEGLTNELETTVSCVRSVLSEEGDAHIYFCEFLVFSASYILQQKQGFEMHIIRSLRSEQN